MKKSKFKESQNVKFLGEQEQGKSVADTCLEHGIRQPAYYGWKRK
jgi:putative transposase